MSGHTTNAYRTSRVALQAAGPQDQLCGVGRQADAGVFSWDVIDLAMMNLTLPQLRAAQEKASEAYGATITRDLAQAIDRLQDKQGWLERCMKVMAMDMPKAVLWQKIRRLRRVLPEPQQQ